MASIYIRGVGPWACDDTAVLCDGGVILTQYPYVDGVTGGMGPPRRQKTDYRVEVGWISTMRPRQGR